VSGYRPTHHVLLSIHPHRKWWVSPQLQ